MANNLQLYGRYIAVSLRSQMQYRASFIMLSLGQFMATGIEFIGCSTA
jgi:ABC-2 type transport system permease protein